MTCKLQRHNKITCKVTFPKAKKTNGKLQMAIARGKHVAALGNARVKRGTATLTLREIHRVTRGSWTVTTVLTQPRHKAATSTGTVRVR